MSEQHSANVNITNDTAGNATIYLFHEITDEGMQGGHWQATPGQTVGPLTVHYDTGVGSHTYDWWSVLVHVEDGPNPGVYVNSGGEYPPWYEYALDHKDNDQTLTFAVSTSEFTIRLADGTTTNAMKKIAPRDRVTHVFVVMLENRSFDHMFAMSGIPGIEAATLGNYNEYKNKQYLVQKGAPLSLPTDPGHEFHDTVEQLCGEGKQNDWKPGGPFPPINNSGFVANYATTTDELTGLPPESAWGDVMSCFDTPTQLPVLYQLATEFAVCDHWFSSLPGPRADASANPLHYPFRSYDGQVTFTRERTGTRTFDLNTDGVAHYGLIADLIGEIGILCDVPRTATVKASSNLTTLRISKDLFFSMVTDFPAMGVEIMRELAHRLDHTTTQLREALARTPQ